MSMDAKAEGILLVCDANVCRSVIGQFVLSEALAAHQGFASIPVSSAGVKAEPNTAPCAHAVGMRSAPSWSKRVAAHRSTQVKSESVDHARLILTATRTSRAAIATLVPGARRRVFTLREAVWLAEGFSPQSGAEGDDALTAFVDYLDRKRGVRPLPEVRRRLWGSQVHPLDISDGHLLGGRAHSATVQQVALLSTRIAGFITADPTLRFLWTGAPAVK